MSLPNRLKRLMRRVHARLSPQVIIPQPLVLSPADRCLILAPHADDESIGCGALLLAHPTQCHVVVLTDGAMGIPGVPEAQVVATRQAELYAAMAMAGVSDVTWLGIPDQTLGSAAQALQSLTLADYTYIFIPNPLDAHPDHQAVTRLLAQAIRQGRVAAKTRVGFYEVWAALALPTAFIDLTGREEAKRALIRQYASQTQFHDYAGKILALNTYRGLAVGTGAAEMYTLMDRADVVAWAEAMA